VIVSDSRKFIFLHNPKAAGTSIRKALLPFDSRDNFYWKFQDSRALGRKLDKAHMAADDFRVEFPDDFARAKDYFVFMFVRDPYDRAVSAYNETIDRALSVLTTRGAMEKYARALNRFILEKCDERSIRYDFDMRFFVPQYAVGHASSEEITDYVGRFEELDNSLAEITRLAGLPEDTFRNIARANARNRDYEPMALLSPEAIARINTLYARDFETFGYEVRSPDSAKGVEPSSQILTALQKRFRFLSRRRKPERA
jgi:sulfotransferase famil protein